MITCVAEQLAKDLELFVHHAGRKSVNTEDVILSGKIVQFPSLPVLSYTRGSQLALQFSVCFFPLLSSYI